MAASGMLQCLLALLMFTAALSPAAAGSHDAMGRRMLTKPTPPPSPQPSPASPAPAVPLACPASFGGGALPASVVGECSGPSYNCPTSSCVANGLGSNDENCSVDNGNSKKCPGATCSPLGGCTGLKCFGVITGDTPFAGQACFYDGSSDNFKICGSVICGAPKPPTPTPCPALGPPPQPHPAGLTCPVSIGGGALPANAEGECSGPSYNCPTSSCVANGLGSNDVNCSEDNGNNKKCPGATCSPLGGCTGLKCFGVITGDTPFAGQACFYNGSSDNFKICGSVICGGGAPPPSSSPSITPSNVSPQPEPPTPSPTPASPSPAPESPAPESPAPESPAPESPAPESPAPESPAPESQSSSPAASPAPEPPSPSPSVDPADNSPAQSPTPDSPGPPVEPEVYSPSPAPASPTPSPPAPRPSPTPITPVGPSSPVPPPVGPTPPPPGPVTPPTPISPPPVQPPVGPTPPGPTPPTPAWSPIPGTPSPPARPVPVPSSSPPSPSNQRVPSGSPAPVAPPKPVAPVAPKPVAPVAPKPVAPVAPKPPASPQAKPPVKPSPAAAPLPPRPSSPAAKPLVKPSPSPAPRQCNKSQAWGTKPGGTCFGKTLQQLLPKLAASKTCNGFGYLNGGGHHTFPLNLTMKTGVDPNRCWSGPSAGINLATGQMSCDGRGTMSFTFGAVKRGHQLTDYQLYASCRAPTTCLPTTFPYKRATVTGVVRVPAAAGGWGADCRCPGGVTPYFMMHATHSTPC